LDGPIGQELLDTLKNQQVVGIGFYDDGYKQITGNKPLIAPADFKGLKFRTMESAIIMEQYRALGADPVPIDYAEVYSALQMGVVDGHENPIVLISDMKFHEVQQYIMISNHAFLGGVLLYASSWFSKLPEDLQQIFVDAGQSMVKRQRQGVAQIEADLLKDIAATGTHIIELTDAQKEALRLATLPVHEIYRKEFGGAILDKIYAEVEKLSK
jgi:C4-dicarboxylate-binding protein DctP